MQRGLLQMRSVVFPSLLKRVSFQFQKSTAGSGLSGLLWDHHKHANPCTSNKYEDSGKFSFLDGEVVAADGFARKSRKCLKETDWFYNRNYSAFQGFLIGKLTLSHLKSTLISQTATQLAVQGVIFESYCSSAKDQLRAPFWRGKKVISLEAQRATVALKAAKNSPRRLDAVVRSNVARLLKVDMLSVIYSLQQQNETNLALLVFNLVRKEIWYKPEVPFYRDMMEALGKNGQFEEVQKLLEELQAEGLKLQMIVFIEIIQNCISWRRFSLAMDYLERMKHSECPPNVHVYRTFINTLNKMGEFDFSAQLEKDCEQYFQSSVTS